MKGNTKIVIPLIGALIVAVIIFLLVAGNKPTSTTRPAPQVSDSTPKENSRYLEYSKTAFDQSASKRRVLYFYANWCPTCKPANEEFIANADKIPEDVVVLRVNYNDSDTDAEENELAKKYGVTYQHTFVQIDSAGKEVTKWNGGSINELLTNIK